MIDGIINKILGGITKEELDNYINTDGDISLRIRELPYNQRYLLKITMISSEYVITSRDVIDFLIKNRLDLYNEIKNNPKGPEWLDDNIDKMNKLIIYGT